MVDSLPRLRPARPDEAPAVTDLIVRSKRSWGYSEEFMALVGADMVISAADIETDHVEVLAIDDELIGMIRLQRGEGHAWLQDLFVDPEAMGRGHGKRLFERAAEQSRGWGYAEMHFDSDPNAESFYLRLGATRIGTTPSSIVPGRTFPRMSYPL